MHRLRKQKLRQLKSSRSMQWQQKKQRLRLRLQRKHLLKLR
jgi:hypothetical protein